MTIAVRYVLFAILSTVANLATQEAVIRALPDAGLPPSIFAGTLVGFALKYVLDKRWVFYDAYTGRRSEARKVSLYGLFSVVTTAIFWTVETAFWLVWKTPEAKYGGAVLGLAIGYAVKYGLDRNFVFREQRA